MVYPKVLTIAGSDSGGGAGIQADLKTISALGCYGTTAITAITVQNTKGVTGIHSVPPLIVAGQISAVLSDIGTDAVKIGMLHSPEIVLAVAGALKKHKITNIVCDPVMVATSGDTLIEDKTIAALTRVLFPMASIITPNLDEACILLGKKHISERDMLKSAKELLKMGSTAVLLKGGHLKGKSLVDVYVDILGNERIIPSEKISSKNVHGTGCTLSSAIAAYVALGKKMPDAVVAAHAYVHKAIQKGKDVKTGNGYGPVNHFFAPRKLSPKKKR